MPKLRATSLFLMETPSLVLFVTINVLRASTSMRTEIFTRDSGQPTSKTAKENSSSATTNSMKEIFLMVANMVSEYTSGPVETSMLETSFKTSGKAWVFINGKTMATIAVNGMQTA